MLFSEMGVFKMRIVLVAKAGIGKIVNIVLNLYVRSKIQNYNFSILCSNCIGGVIYKFGHSVCEIYKAM